MLFLAWIIHTFQNASQQPEPSVPLLLPKMLAKILEQGTTSWLCPKWAAPLYQIPHIRLHLRLPSPTQSPAAYLDSLKQNKGTIPSQSHLTPPWLQHHALCSEVLHGTAEHFAEQMQQCESLPHRGTSYCTLAAPWKHPWMCLDIVQYTLRPLVCLGNNLFTSHVPSHTTAWVLPMECLLYDLSDEI